MLQSIFYLLAQWVSKRFFILLVVIFSISLVWIPVGFAAPIQISDADLATQSAIAINVDLGNSTNELKFFPNQLNLIAGKRYQLILKNPSPQKHYFTAKDFADVSWTQKVEAGRVEIKGGIRELELKPGSEAQWVLIPIKSGKYHLHCSIPGHTEAGMTGTITILAQPVSS